MTLYLKYRPNNLDELDLVDVSGSLKKIVSKNSIPHAFLFAGPKGTGKTSAARIMAKILNCEDLKGSEPCNKCKQCLAIDKCNSLDVIEMDAASHRGIDDVRILRDAVKLSPSSAKNKVYIIDEVHMLTTEAENALLKTLEEPPSNVYFILATTNPEKLIDTIRSRTTLIPFKKASKEEIVRSLRRPVNGEKIKIDDDVLALIAEAADGSFRDAVKILEQVVAEEKDLSKEAMEEFLFKNKSFDLDNFINLLIGKKTKELLAEVEGLSSKGVSIENFLESLTKKLRIGLLSKVGVGDETLKDMSKNELIKILELINKAYTEIESSPIEELPLELAIISWCEGEDKNGELEKKVKEVPEKNETTEVVNKSSEPMTDTVQTQEQVLVDGEMSMGDDSWKSILALVKSVNASMEALLRAAKPVSYNGKTLTLGVYYKFHKERIEESHHRKVLEEIVAKVLQSPTKVCCVLVEPPPRKIIEEAKIETVLTEGKDKDIIRAAEEIFSN
jgi:DNA polymerase-3 subunit gamma/tau